MAVRVGLGFSINALREGRLDADSLEEEAWPPWLGLAWNPMESPQSENPVGWCEYHPQTFFWSSHSARGKRTFPSLYRSWAWPRDCTLANGIKRMCPVAASAKLPYKTAGDHLSPFLQPYLCPAVWNVEEGCVGGERALKTVRWPEDQRRVFGRRMAQNPEKGPDGKDLVLP